MFILQSEEYHKNLTQKLQGYLLSTLLYSTFLFLLLSYDQHLYQQKRPSSFSILSSHIKGFAQQIINSRLEIEI